MGIKMTTARIIGLPGVHTVDADPMSNASLMAVGRRLGARPLERIEIEFDAATNAGTRTYLVGNDLQLTYVGRTFKSAQDRRDWLASMSPPAPERKRFALWQWILDRWART